MSMPMFPNLCPYKKRYKNNFENLDVNNDSGLQKEHFDIKVLLITQKMNQFYSFDQFTLKLAQFENRSENRQYRSKYLEIAIFDGCNQFRIAFYILQPNFINFEW